MEKELEQNAPIVEEEKLQNYRKDDDAEEMEKAAKEFKEKEYKFDNFIRTVRTPPSVSSVIERSWRQET